MLSLRWSCGLSLEMLALFVPDRNPGVGSGYAFRSACPFALSWLAGMMLPGNGCPVAGLMITFGEVKNVLAPRSSLKSPRRIFSVGTVAVLVWVWKKLTHSWAAKKNSLFLKASPGTGPPNE